MPHVIQRRRKDVEKWLGADTPFPERVSDEITYELSADYRKLFLDVLAYWRHRTPCTLRPASGSIEA